MQNIPTPEKEPDTILAYQPIKNMFTHTYPGGCLMAVDYSGMELRVFASLAQCEPMLEIHRSGKDFHTMVAVMASGLREDQITKPIRYRFKWTNWTLLFGGDEYTLHRLYGIDLQDCKDTVRTYFERFPEVLDYREACAEFAEEHGYIETPFGNRRPLPYIHSSDRNRRNKAIREAVNTPVQGAAGLVTVMALVIVDIEMRKRAMQSMIVNTVHDSIVFDVHPDEIDNVASLCVDVMENVVDYASLYMPNIDMSWLICPLRAEIEVGTHYGTMEEYEVHT
jgi:DNA polymerase-1